MDVAIIRRLLMLQMWARFGFSEGWKSKWNVDANILNMQWEKSGKGWSSTLEFKRAAENVSPKKPTSYENLGRTSDKKASQ
jgi:hypothetical protein